MAAVVFTETAEVGPVLQVIRGVETHFLLACQYHYPSVGELVPNHFGVTEICNRIHQHRVAGVMGESLSSVRAIGDSLFLALAVGGIYGYQCVGSEAGGVVAVDDCRTGEDRSQSGRSERDRLMLPVDEVTAGGMCPVHVMPPCAIGVVLVIEVPDTCSLIVEHSVGVIHPSVVRCLVVLRAVREGIQLRIEICRFGRRGMDSIPANHVFPFDGVGYPRANLNEQIAVAPTAEVVGHKIIDGIFRQPYVDQFELLIVRYDTDTGIALRILNRQPEQTLCAVGAQDRYLSTGVLRRMSGHRTRSQ